LNFEFYRERIDHEFRFFGGCHLLVLEVVRMSNIFCISVSKRAYFIAHFSQLYHHSQAKPLKFQVNHQDLTAFAYPKKHRYFLSHPKRQKLTIQGRCFNPNLLENGRLSGELRFSRVHKMASLIKEDAVDPGVSTEPSMGSH
jgi:hypothetical protein